MTRSHSFAELLRRRSGLMLPLDRFAQCVRRLGYADIDTAYATLVALPLDSAGWQALLRELSIGETYFFRDTAPIESALNRLVQRRQEERTLRVWSAGCSTGEEAYTLAFLIREAIPDADTWQINILGTDINSSALATAQRAVYGAWSLRAPDTLVRGAFSAYGDRWHVAHSIRHMVNFRVLNLADDNAMYPAADLIICRNVLMYLDPTVQVRVRSRLQAALAPGGALVIDTFSPALGQSALIPQSLTPTIDLETRLIQPSIPDVTTSIYDQARGAADQHDWDAVHRLLDSASPLDLPCAWLRALVYQQQNQVDAAISAVRHCLYIDHNFALGYFVLGTLYAGRGASELAVRQWENAQRLTAQLAPDALLDLGEGLTARDVLRVIETSSLSPAPVGSAL